MIRLRYPIAAAAVAVVLTAVAVVMAVVAADWTVQWMRDLSVVQSSDGTDAAYALSQYSYSMQQFAGPMLLAALVCAVTAVVLWALRVRTAPER